MATEEQSPIAIDVKEAARLLNLSTGSIRNRIRSGELPAVHIGRSVRISTAALEKLVNPAGSKE